MNDEKQSCDAGDATLEEQDVNTKQVVQQWIPMDRHLFQTYRHLHLAAIQKLDNLFTSANIPYWICGGTLLGAIRHAGFIPHDDDLDIECLQQDLVRIANLSVDTSFWGLADGGQWQGFPVKKLNFRGDVSIDVFPRVNTWTHVDEEKEESESNGRVTESVERKYFPSLAEEVFPLRPYRFENIQVWGPSCPDAYLKRLYDEDCFENVLVYNHDYNYFHCNSHHPRRTVLKLNSYNQMIQNSGIHPPIADMTAEETYRRAFSNFEGGEQEFVNQMKRYRHERALRWNRADAEYRYEQEELKVKEKEKMAATNSEYY